MRKALRLPLGLLIDFNVPLPKDGVKRVVLSEPLGVLGALVVHEDKMK
ncbi:MAG: hypothetical protein RDV41_13200 [Planctomycetota bacterium]|nr:hypothetical protein [Planctomycetota bacterium]